nr:pilus assembly protein [Methylorubrum salsuginis]
MLEHRPGQWEPAFGKKPIRPDTPSPRSERQPPTRRAAPVPPGDPAPRPRRWAFARFAVAEGGATAVEFAFVAPMLMLLLVAAIEMPRAVATQNRLSQATTAMADLISRQDQTRIDDVYAAAPLVAAPYSVAGLGIRLTAGGVYQVGQDFVARVCSSVQQGMPARAVDSDLGPPPSGTGFKGDRFVMAETQLTYRPLFSFFPILNNLTFTGKAVWPVRDGVSYNGQPEVVLPNGKPCRS